MELETKEFKVEAVAAEPVQISEEPVSEEQISGESVSGEYFSEETVLEKSLEEWEEAEKKTERSGGVFSFMKGNNAGVGVIELILILVVLVALVLVFKEQLTGMVERAMAALEKSMERILG